MENIHIILIIFLVIFMFKKSKNKENFTEITAEEEKQIVDYIKTLPTDDEVLKQIYWENTTQVWGKPCQTNSCGRASDECIHPRGREFECKPIDNNTNGPFMCVPASNKDPHCIIREGPCCR